MLEQIYYKIKANLVPVCGVVVDHLPHVAFLHMSILRVVVDYLHLGEGPKSTITVAEIA